ncbi:unnamed protein product [Prunus armeniaca]
MKYKKKDAHLLGPKKLTHDDKLRRFPRKLSPLTYPAGKTVEEICSVETTRR